MAQTVVIRGVFVGGTIEKVDDGYVYSEIFCVRLDGICKAIKPMQTQMTGLNPTSSKLASQANEGATERSNPIIRREATSQKYNGLEVDKYIITYNSKYFELKNWNDEN